MRLPWFRMLLPTCLVFVCAVGASLALTQSEPDTPPAGTQWPVIGDGGRNNASESGRRGGRGESFTLSFDQASIPSVIEAVVGTMLERSFVIDPTLQDRTITLRSASPVRSQDLLPLLDQALRLAGAGLVERADGTVAVLPAEQIRGFVTAPVLAGQGGARLGAIVIVPLQYVSAREMQRVLELIANDRAVVRIDEVREYVILSGDSSLLHTLQETIALFDADWLQDASFDLVQVRYAGPEVIAADVRRVLGGEQGIVGTQVELVPLPRLSSILVVTKRPERLRSIREWISRFDAPPPADPRTVHFRGISNLPASDVAQALATLLGEGNAGTPARAAADAEGAPPPVARMGDGIRVQTAPQTNGLLIYATSEEFQRLDRIIDSIDALPDQVLVEVTIAEVTLNDQLQYGVQWFLDTRDGGTATFSTAANGSVSSSFPGFSYQFQGTHVRAVLNALSSVSDVNVVSSPQLMTINGATAHLQVGDQVPVVVQSSSGLDDDNPRIINSINYRDTGIVLSITPRAGSEGLVLIDIALEVSDVVGTTSSGIDSPTIQQRRFETRVAIPDDETVALGGLIRTTRSIGETRVPLLGQVPLLGAAFRSRDRRVRRTELLVFLTPRVVRSLEDARRSTEELRSRLERLRLDGFDR